MANILIHSLVFAPDSVSTAYLMTDLARQLQRRGHGVSVLTSTPHYNRDSETLSRQPLETIWPRLLYKSQCDGIPVWHVKMPPRKQRVSGRMFDLLRFHIVSLVVGLTVLGSYDIVIAPSPPLTIGIVAWLLALRRRAGSVYNVQEIYPDFAVNQGLIRNRTLIGVLRTLERFVYARSASVVPISKWFSRRIRLRGVAPHKLVVIPNSVDTELYRPLPRSNAFAQEHGLVNDFVVLYGGNIGLSQDWESLLFAAQALASFPIKFVLVGDGVRQGWLQSEVINRQLSNVRFLGYQPRELMPQINATSDIGTIPMKAGTTSDTFPSKIYGILACARPAIVSADDDSELAWIIRESQCGRCVPPDNPQAYTDAIMTAFLERADLPIEGERGRRFVEQEYSKEAVGQKYHNLIGQLTGKQ